MRRTTWPDCARACGITYADAAGDAVLHDVLGVAIPVASPATLIKTKNTDRPQDAIDRGFLEGLGTGSKR